jgi:hypothetical protein
VSVFNDSGERTATGPAPAGIVTVVIRLVE